MPDTNEPFTEPLTSQPPASTEPTEDSPQPPQASVETIKLSDNYPSQLPPKPSVGYEKKSL